jgi:hypothetical protein
MSCFLQPFDSSIHLPNLFYGPKGISTFWLLSQKPTALHLATHPTTNQQESKRFFTTMKFHRRSCTKDEIINNPITLSLSTKLLIPFKTPTNVCIPSHQHETHVYPLEIPNYFLLNIKRPHKLLMKPL